MEQNELAAVLKELGKRYGAHKIIDPALLAKVKIERIPTGSLALDLEMGGGWPLGRMVEIYGWESCCKTMLALKAVAEIQKFGKKPVWVDIENSFDAEWAKTLGVDLAKIVVIQPDTGEEAADYVDAVTRTPEVGIVVLDAIADMLPTMDDETPMTESERIGGRALMMNRLTRKLRVGLNTRSEEGTLNNNLVILINQKRQKIGVVYGNPETTPGGVGVKFSSAIRLEMRTGEWIEEEQNGEDIKIGRKFKFQTVKNKTYIPYRSSEFVFYFGGERKGQIDNVEALANYMLLLGLATQKGPSVSMGEQKFQGRGGLLEFLTDKKNYAKYEKQTKDLYIK